MKRKVLFLFFVVLMASCSADSDSNSTPDDNATLIRKLISTNESEFGIRKDTTYYNYNGTKMVSVTSGHLVHQFFYTGDLITHIRDYYNGQLNADLVFQYNDLGKITHSTEYVYEPEQRVNRKSDFTYNLDGSVTSEFYIYDVGEQLLTHAYTYNYFFNTHGDIERTEIVYPEGTTVEHRIYDNKHSPFMNIKGYKAIDFMLLGILSNITSITYSGYDSGHNQESEMMMTYTYNENDFPVNGVRTFPHMLGSTPTTEEYFYQ